MDYRVRLAEKTDLTVVPDIEKAAAQRFRPYVAWLNVPLDVLEGLTTASFLLSAQADDRLWVAAVGGRPVGFIVAKFLTDSCFVVELDVHPDYGRMGMGSALVNACCEGAIARGFNQVTLTTFRRIPWNIPFYQRLGFEILPSELWSQEIDSIVHSESRYGFAPEKRAVMRRMLRNGLNKTSKENFQGDFKGNFQGNDNKRAQEGWTDG